MAKEFKPGDQVQLKSGGPVMTVEVIYPPMGSSKENTARCKWFVGDTLKEGTFVLSALREPEGPIKF